MRTIQTNNYLKKQAQLRDLPGDPGLPPGTTNRMIEQHLDGGDVTDLSKQAGEYQTTTSCDVTVRYEYDAEIYGEEVIISNLRPLTIDVDKGNIFENLKDVIIEQEKIIIKEQQFDQENLGPDTREEML